MERNKKLFNAVAKRVKDEEGHHYDQGYYAYALTTGLKPPTLCETAFCIAGHVGIELGWVPIFRKLKYDRGWEHIGWDAPDGLRMANFQLEEAAQKALGLTLKEASNLFHGHWEPKGRMSVPGALMRLGKGAEIDDVSSYGKM